MALWCAALQAIDAMMFYQVWAPNLPDIITHRASIRKDAESKKSSFQIGGRVSVLAAAVDAAGHQIPGPLLTPAQEVTCQAWKAEAAAAVAMKLSPAMRNSLFMHVPNGHWLGRCKTGSVHNAAKLPQLSCIVTLPTACVLAAVHGYHRGHQEGFDRIRAA